MTNADAVRIFGGVAILTWATTSLPMDRELAVFLAFLWGYGLGSLRRRGAS